MKLIIHIGYPKTGSTAIQSHTFTNLRWLRERGTFVPMTGYGSGAGHQHLLPPPAVVDKYEKENELPPRLEFLKAELSQAESEGFEQALITWEGLGGADVSQIRGLARATADHEVSVLAYVRENSDRFQSDVLQQIQRLQFDGNARHLLGGISFDRVLRDAGKYYRSLSKWSTAFGDKVKIRTKIFDRSRFYDNNVVLDFFQWLGLTPDSEFSLQSGNTNQSIDVASAAAILFAREVGLDGGSLVKLSRAVLLNIECNGAGSRYFLTLEEQDKIWEHYLEDNRNLFERFRPENASADEVEFERAKRRANQSPGCLDIEFLRNIIEQSRNLKRELWEGNTLVNQNLAWLTGPPNSGWGEFSENGFWSKGPVSELGFNLPQIGAALRPVGLELEISGEYSGSHCGTRIKVAGFEKFVDLKRTTISFPFQDEMLTEGVYIQLIHDASVDADHTDDDSAVARCFKITQLSYKFRW